MNIEWTHKNVTITDVRRVKNFYVISIDVKKIEGPLFVDLNIFEGRLKSYYLKDSPSGPHKLESFNRSDILNVKWNMVINKGYFIKYNNNEREEINKDPEKYYISFLEIDGPLGTHISN